jgi:hypothetical protein
MDFSFLTFWSGKLLVILACRTWHNFSSHYRVTDNEEYKIFTVKYHNTKHKNNKTFRLHETLKISHPDVYTKHGTLVNSYTTQLHANLNSKIQKLSLAHSHDHYLCIYGSQNFVTMLVYVFITQKIQQSNIPFHQTCKLSTDHLYSAPAECIPSYRMQ